MPPVINLVDPAPTFSSTVRVPFATLLASDGRFLEGRLDMFLARTSMAVLVVIALGLSACAAIDVYPTPRPIDLSVGLDEGLITRDWDGGHPMRRLALLANPVGVALGIGLNQTRVHTFAT